MAAPLITIEQARLQILERVPVPGAEPAPVLFALGRVLAADVLAHANTPPFRSSAMDGYAIQSGPAGRRLTIIGESRAGTPSDRGTGTGGDDPHLDRAAVPDGADAVIPQENVIAHEGSIETAAEVRAGEHVRAPGEDMRAGARILEAGTRLGAIELGAAVTAGLGDGQRGAAARTWRCSAPAMSCAPRVSRWARARSTIPTLRC